VPVQFLLFDAEPRWLLPGLFREALDELEYRSPGHCRGFNDA